MGNGFLAAFIASVDERLGPREPPLFSPKSLLRVGCLALCKGDGPDVLVNGQQMRSSDKFT